MYVDSQTLRRYNTLLPDLNQVISVKKSDFEVFDALDIDSINVSGSQAAGKFLQKSFTCNGWF